MAREGEGKMTELAASTALSELVAALIANKIQAPVPDETVQQLQDQENWKEKWTYQSLQRLLDKKEWIYRSKRVEDLLKKLEKEELLYSVFNSQHHIQSASRLFEFLKDKDSCVVYGHKAQGKTQFLFFVFKLLQAMGEKVLFLDRTIKPSKSDQLVPINSAKFCGKLWEDDFLQIEGPVKDTLENFFQDALPMSFGKFFSALKTYTMSSSETRIWIIVDEVVLFEDFPIDLPEEQDPGPFNWIVTGSAGIGSWVAERHLENLVFDLPLFTKEECIDFANNLCKSLRINIENEIDGGVDDWLEERFGGVVGYIAEMFLEVSQGKSVSHYMLTLSSRIDEIFMKNAKDRKTSAPQVAEEWLIAIKSDENNWNRLRDAGLCGRSAPRGIIFSLILKWLYTFSPKEDALSLVSLFRRKFSGDPGLDGCLLELEEILKLRANTHIGASLITSIDQEWCVEKSIDLPPRGTLLNVLRYDERLSRLEETVTSTSSSWCLIQIPAGFNVIDVVLVDASQSPAMYGIQITRSAKPFATHRTFDTCLQRSKERLYQLWTVIRQYFQLKNATKAYYVMLAPNCERDKIKPPRRHESDYYFSPTRTIPETSVSNPKKRASSDRYPARHPSKKKN